MPWPTPWLKRVPTSISNSKSQAYHNQTHDKTSALLPCVLFYYTTTNRLLKQTVYLKQRSHYWTRWCTDFNFWKTARAGHGANYYTKQFTTTAWQYVQLILIGTSPATCRGQTRSSSLSKVVVFVSKYLQKVAICEYNQYWYNQLCTRPSKLCQCQIKLYITTLRIQIEMQSAEISVMEICSVLHAWGEWRGLAAEYLVKCAT